MKTLTLRNIETGKHRKFKADDKRILGYKGFVQNVRVGEHVTYMDRKSIFDQNGIVVKIEN